jgi:hypothetical protein
MTSRVCAVGYTFAGHDARADLLSGLAAATVAKHAKDEKPRSTRRGRPPKNPQPAQPGFQSEYEKTRITEIGAPGGALQVQVRETTVYAISSRCRFYWTMSRRNKTKRKKTRRARIKTAATISIKGLL